MNTSWFSHDSNARNSKKLIRLRQKYGAAGYGVYWMLVERLRDEEAYTSDKDYDMIAFDLRVDVELIRAVVEDFGLFDISEDGKTFHAPGLDERMELKDARSAAGKKGAEARRRKMEENRDSQAQDSKVQSNEQANDDFATSIKGSKERKEKKSKNTSSSFSSSSPVGEGVEKAEKEKEEILFNFVFEKNMTAPNKEYEKFMRYNNSDGREWDSLSQSKKDRAIEEWQQKPEKPPRFGEDFLSMWRSLYESLIQHGAPIDVRLDALSDGIRCTVSDGYMKLHCSERFSRYIEEENMEGVRDILWPFVAKYAKKLRYINDVNPTRQSGERDPESAR